MLKAAPSFIRWCADSVAAALLATLFGCFIVQIVSRYIFNSPLSWTTEACLIAWLWLVFLGGGMLVKNREHVRFDVLSAAAPLRFRRLAAIVGGLFMVATFSWSLPASIDFVRFMAIERSGTLRIPLNLVFSVFIIFASAVIVRQAYYLSKLLRGADPETLEPGNAEGLPF